MKHLLEYLTEALTVNEASGNYDALIQKLASNTELGKYVDYLNAMIKDKDAREVLTKAFMNSEEEDHLESLVFEKVKLPTDPIMMDIMAMIMKERLIVVLGEMNKGLEKDEIRSELMVILDLSN